MSTTPDRPNDPAAALWKECIAGWKNLVLAFGHPVDLVRWGWMRALEYRALGHWLRRLEALVRHAILADALAREVPALKPRAAGARAGKRRAEPASAEDMPRFRPTCRIDPTSWKVTFRMPKPHVELDDETPNARHRSRPFAYRIEALRRANSYREDYVLRFACRLTRLAETGRAACLPGATDSFARAPVRTLIQYPPRSLATALDPILWTAKYAEPG